MVRDKLARPQLFLEISGTDQQTIIKNPKNVTNFSINEFQKAK